MVGNEESSHPLLRGELGGTKKSLVKYPAERAYDGDLRSLSRKVWGKYLFHVSFH